jgi:hypothetical protein
MKRKKMNKKNIIFILFIISTICFVTSGILTVIFENSYMSILLLFSTIFYITMYFISLLNRDE